MAWGVPLRLVAEGAGPIRAGGIGRRWEQTRLSAACPAQGWVGVAGGFECEADPSAYFCPACDGRASRSVSSKKR